MTLQPILDGEKEKGGAIAASGTVATQASPGARAGLRHSVSIDYRGTLRPTFVCRTLKPPHMRGHRTYLEVPK